MSQWGAPRMGMGLSEVVAWNFFLFLISWWLFGIQTFELLQAGKSPSARQWKPEPKSDRA